MLGWAFLAREEVSSVFPDLGVEESYVHTPTPGRLCTAAVETGSLSNRSLCRLERACQRRALCHCWCVEGSQAAHEAAAFLTPLLPTLMQDNATSQCQPQRAWALSASDGRVPSEEALESRP